MIELKLCPFCGKEADVTDTYSEHRGPYSIVFCRSCGEEGPKRRMTADTRLKPGTAVQERRVDL